MHNIIDIKKYIPDEKDKFFFDTNIWMFLFCPLGNYKKNRIKIYADFLKTAIQSKSSIFISSLILSEFFNSWVKLDYNILKNSNPQKYENFKKNYRNTTLYNKQISIIKKVIIRKIMSIAQKVDDEFENIDLNELFENMKKIDFNDKYLLKLGTLNNFKIITDDFDFAFFNDPSISILTANKKLLKKSIVI